MITVGTARISNLFLYHTSIDSLLTSLTRRLLLRHSWVKSTEWCSVVNVVPTRACLKRCSRHFSFDVGAVVHDVLCMDVNLFPAWFHVRANRRVWTVHLLKNNAGALMPVRWWQKPCIDWRCNSWLDSDVHYASGLLKHGLWILLCWRVFSKSCHKSYHRNNWIVAAKC